MRYRINKNIELNSYSFKILKKLRKIFKYKKNLIYTKTQIQNQFPGINSFSIHLESEIWNFNRNNNKGSRVMNRTDNRKYIYIR